MPTTASLTVGRGMSGARPTEAVIGAPVKFGWTNGRIDSVQGTEPIELMLDLLISTGGGNNWNGTGTNYDVFEPGIGLGVPQGRVNIASFEAVRAQYDWDVNFMFYGKWLKPDDDHVNGRPVPMRRAHHYKRGMPNQAKDLIEQEVCAPLGLYLVTANDGTIKLVRPKNPSRFHFSKANNVVSVNVPPGPATYTVTLPVGVLNYSDVLSNLNSIGHNFTFSYSTATNLFSVVHTGSSTWDVVASPGWKTLGFTAAHTGNADGTPLSSDVTAGAFVGTTLTEGDMWDVKQVVNRADQITSVIYEYDYDLANDDYAQQRQYISAEDYNLAFPQEVGTLTLKCKGLGSSENNPQFHPGSFWKEPTSGCDPVRVLPPTGSGIDYDSIAMLYSAMLLDRYRQPPLKFQAKLRWKHNTLEVGDVVQISYSIPGLFTDRELDQAQLTGRLFEITQLNPNYTSGYMEATFLGHRAATAPSMIVTAVS